MLKDKPIIREIKLEIRARQNGCHVCGGTGVVTAGVVLAVPGFLPCSRCGWEWRNV